jgi:hypothetical protein
MESFNFMEYVFLFQLEVYFEKFWFVLKRSYKRQTSENDKNDKNEINKRKTLD